MAWKKMVRKCAAFGCEDGIVYDYSLGYRRNGRLCHSCGGRGTEKFITMSDPQRRSSLWEWLKKFFR